MCQETQQVSKVAGGNKGIPSVQRVLIQLRAAERTVRWNELLGVEHGREGDSNNNCASNEEIAEAEADCPVLVAPEHSDTETRARPTGYSSAKLWRKIAKPEPPTPRQRPGRWNKRRRGQRQLPPSSGH
ncbi:MAG: hypothetical protein V3W41_03785 [Planctomycetota bacterium]